jgi:hypothetical protein
MKANSLNWNSDVNMITTLLLKINFTVNKDDLFSVIMSSVEVIIICVKVSFVREHFIIFTYK